MMLNLFYRSQRSTRHPTLYITAKKNAAIRSRRGNKPLSPNVTNFFLFFLKIVYQDFNKSFEYATDDLYSEYKSRGLTKSGCYVEKEEITIPCDRQ